MPPHPTVFLKKDIFDKIGKYKTNAMDRGIECEYCPVGKYSIDDGASSCVEHAKCPAAYYLDAMPKSDSSKISCTRCIYMSNFYYSGFVFALVVIGLNMLFFLSYCSISYAVVGGCLSICPTCWIMFLNF